MSPQRNLPDLPAPASAASEPWPAGEQLPGSSLAESPDYEWPRISIVTPSFNQGRWLEKTIRSVLLQGYPNLEYILVDGGSRDESVDLIKKYEPWIQYWVSEPDDGQCDAINKGFSKATGQILGWVNSDDWLASGALSSVAGAWMKRKPSTAKSKS